MHVHLSYATLKGCCTGTGYTRRVVSTYVSRLEKGSISSEYLLRNDATEGSAIWQNHVKRTLITEFECRRRRFEANLGGNKLSAHFSTAH